MEDKKLEFLESPWSNFQLTEAAQILSCRKITTDQLYSSPDGWDPVKWEEHCNKSYLERVQISAVLLQLESQRIQDLILEIGEENLKSTNQI
jgi:hypothetical protein